MEVGYYFMIKVNWDILKYVPKKWKLKTEESRRQPETTFWSDFFLVKSQTRKIYAEQLKKKQIL